jgi:hypothetical protein
MQEWIDTRGKATHPFTEELLNAIRTHVHA